MALIKCPECGKEISDQAPSCPHCGVVLKKAFSISDIPTGAWFAIVIVILGIFTYFLISPYTANPTDMPNDVYEIGCDALQVVDDCIDMKISPSKARDDLDVYHDKLELARQKGEKYSTSALSLQISITSCSVAMIDLIYTPNSDAWKKLQEERNSFAEELKKNKRDF